MQMTIEAMAFGNTMEAANEHAEELRILGADRVTAFKNNDTLYVAKAQFDVLKNSAGEVLTTILAVTGARVFVEVMTEKAAATNWQGYINRESDELTFETND